MVLVQSTFGSGIVAHRLKLANYSGRQWGLGRTAAGKEQKEADQAEMLR
ncbi:hypothetical protein [Planktothrix sp.]